MPHSPRKAPFECPHCGFVQHEPPHLISTYCRSCGSHYEVAAAKARRDPASGIVGASAPRPVRPVHCHQCGGEHHVSPSAVSTICPGCNASIDLGDLIFSTSVSRPVDTRGRLVVEAGGCINNTRIICGEALIEGKINGRLICEGELHLACKARLAHAVSASSIVIHKDADVEFVQPIKTADLVVHGRASGTFECTGRVKISKRGVLEGRLVARSVVVERGGSLLAASSIRSAKPLAQNPARRPESPGNFDTANPLPA